MVCRIRRTRKQLPSGGTCGVKEARLGLPVAHIKEDAVLVMPPPTLLLAQYWQLEPQIQI